MDEQRRTCGPLFQEGLEASTDLSENESRIFCEGFIAGQAEKIYLGACKAAMFRPPPERYRIVWAACQAIASRYHLHCHKLSRDGEIWLYDPSVEADVVWSLNDIPYHSAEWHTLRGRLCGIPAEQIDPRFHERKEDRRVKGDG